MTVSVSKLKFSQNHLHGFQHDGNFGKQLLAKREDDMAVRREVVANSFESASSGKFMDKKSAPCSPTRIMIMKPNSDINDEMEESPEVVERGSSSMEDFLEEVKERLRLEMEGKGRNDFTRRLSVGHTFLHESSINLKQKAREAAKHGAMLRKSQSVITHRNAFNFDGHDSSKSIKRETSKIISDKLKNVLKDDTEMKAMIDDGMAGNSLSVKEKRNYPFFFLFISLSTILYIYVFTFSWLNLVEEKKNYGNSLWNSMKREIFSLVLIVYTFIPFWFVGGLTVFHIYLISTNQTTYENFRYCYDKKENPYSQGILKNFGDVYCTKIPPSLNNFRSWVLEEELQVESMTPNQGLDIIFPKEDMEMGTKAGLGGNDHLKILQNLD